MKKFFYLIWAVVISGAGRALAQVHLDQGYLGDANENLVKYEGATAEDTVNQFLLHTADVLLYFAASIAVLALVVGAFHLVKGRGNEDAVSEAKTTILWSIIGLFIVIFSYSLVRTVIYLAFSAID